MGSVAYAVADGAMSGAGAHQSLIFRNAWATDAAIVGTGNIGCITQIALADELPVVHTTKLVDRSQCTTYEIWKRSMPCWCSPRSL